MINPWWIGGISRPGCVATPGSPSTIQLSVSHTETPAGPFRGGGGISLCKPFLLFQPVCPQPSTIQFAHSTVLCKEPRRKTTQKHVWCTKLPLADRPAWIQAMEFGFVCVRVLVCTPVGYLLVVLPCIWMIHFESLLISLELKGRTRTATFTDAPDMFAV